MSYKTYKIFSSKTHACFHYFSLTVNNDKNQQLQHTSLWVTLTGASRSPA